MFPSSASITIPLTLAAFLWMAAPLAALFSARDTNSRRWSVLFFLGALCVLLAGIDCFGHPPVRIVLPAPLGLGPCRFAFRCDPLSGWFLGVIGGVSAMIAPYLRGYCAHIRARVDMRLFWCALSGLAMSMALVVLAANALTFLVVWELMSLTSFLLVATDHEPRANRRAALIYLAATRFSTAFLAVGFLWTHALTGSWEFGAWRLAGPAALVPGLFVLAGLFIKAGVFPFHLWLPIAHPSAPSPVSALMSGVMVKVAIAVLVRLFVIDPAFTNSAFGILIVVLGAISALWGVLFALVQHDLKRLLAYHTVENIGLILMGAGIAILAGSHGPSLVAQIALAAALFHVLNHALFKSLLFLGAGSVDVGAGTRDLDRLGGLAKSMPWTFGFFTLGAASICALPPFNGFASEWLLYQSFLGSACGSTAPIHRFGALLLIGLLCLVGALAVACFTKAVGVVFQGMPRSVGAQKAHEATSGMIVSQAALAASCVILGLSAPAVLGILQVITAPLPVAGANLLAAWNLPFGALVTSLVITLLAGRVWLRHSQSRLPEREFITWECGFGALGPRAQVAATSFVQPIASMFCVVLQYAQSLESVGENARLFPDELTAHATTEPVLETRVYGPAARWLVQIGDQILKFQAGSIHLYLLTMVVTLLILLAIGGSMK